MKVQWQVTFQEVRYKRCSDCPAIAWQLEPRDMRLTIFGLAAFAAALWLSVGIAAYFWVFRVF